jgi:hypothetical protein
MSFPKLSIEMEKYILSCFLLQVPDSWSIQEIELQYTIPSNTVIKCKSYLYKIKLSKLGGDTRARPYHPLREEKEGWVLFVASDFSFLAKNKSIN